MRFFNALNFIVITSTLTVLAKPTRFEVKDIVGRDLVSFVSEAPLDRLVGITNHVAGWLEVDLENPQTLRAELEVDMRSFETGIELRNEHFREKYLNTADFPFSSFSLKKSTFPPKSVLTDGKIVQGKLEGELKIRNIVKSVTVAAKLGYFKESELTKQRLGGNLLRLSGIVDIEPNQFGISVNENLKLLIAPKVKAHVNIVGTDMELQKLPVPVDRVKEK